MKRYALILWMVLGPGAVAVPGDTALMANLPSMGASISDVRITPAEPTDSEEVSVTVCGWTPATNYRVYDTDLRISGGQIWLDLYWDAPGMGGQAFTPYEHTHPLGTLRAGMYIVHVTNRDLMSGSTTITFTVSPSLPGSSQQPGDGSPLPLDPSMPDWFEQKRQDMAQRLPGSTVGPALPGFDIKDVAWSQVSTIKEGISELRMTPAEPTPSDSVSVTVCGWKSNSHLEVDYADLNIQKKKIWLDLYWHVRPVVVTHGGGAGLLDQVQSEAQVTRYAIDPYKGSPYEVTESLGTFSPGTYTLYVTNHGPVSGEASTVFVVATPDSDNKPWWWTAMRGGR